MERAWGVWLEVVLNNLKGMGYDGEDLAEYKESFERLLGDRELGDELARPILEGEEWPGPEPRLFVDAWARLGCQPLPAEFRWPAALAAFESVLDAPRGPETGGSRRSRVACRC